jgi:methionyl-tRNA synthetase
MTTRLVTSALPYANGPIHLGHMVEHVQTDVYVRFLRSIGDDVTWICAADAHGTPIEVNAGKAGVAPAEFAERHRQEQHATFQRFGIAHDTYYTTHSPENQAWAYRIYDALKARGLIYKKSVEQLYCERDQRFLPDRFVKGTCPKCATPDRSGRATTPTSTSASPRWPPSSRAGWRPRVTSSRGCDSR